MSAEMVNPAPEPDYNEVFTMNMAEEDAATERLSAYTLTGDPVKDYLKAIGKTPLLNAEMEVELAKTIEAGLVSEQLLAERRTGQASALGDMATRFAHATDEELEWLVEAGMGAIGQMQEANLRLVVSIAKKYSGRDMEFLDLIQEGNHGLHHAVEKFDFAKGYKFSTYSTWWIRQAITRSMAEQSRNIRLPVHMVEKINQMERTERQMLKDTGHDPTAEEVAAKLGITTEKIIEYKRYARHTISLETPLGNGSIRGQSEGQLVDLIEDTTVAEPTEAFEYSDMQTALRQVLYTLDEREAGVIRMRFGLDDGISKTLDEIGKVYEVSRERIRQIEAKTLCKLRHPSRSQRLRDYL
jgi:RNA polymerase primary sigma factor